ncbi:hypothetical protein MP228_000354 [Amoeboaphelidium protococcarum]|nr:hypothetical protein MP228_000354 [Amoeboaphelidium protococcarum]
MPLFQDYLPYFDDDKREPSSARSQVNVLAVSNGPAADASFTLHLSVQHALKNGNCILVSFSQTIHHYLQIQKKLGYSRLDNRLIFCDGLSQLQQNQQFIAERSDSANSSDGNIHRLSIDQWEDQIIDVLGQKCTQNGESWIVIDDLSVLECIGVPLEKMTRFLHRLRDYCYKHKVNQLIHINGLVSHDNLRNFMIYGADYVVECQPLLSGKSVEVDGSVGFFSQYSSKQAARDILHYKVTEYGVKLSNY